jgi:hypothetical protein
MPLNKWRCGTNLQLKADICLLERWFNKVQCSLTIDLQLYLTVGQLDGTTN